MMSPTPRRTRLLIPITTTVLLAGALTACGGDGDGSVELSEAGRRGYDLARTNGCASCHGSNGEGGVGPKLVGLFGSEVELDDGTTVTADRDYLVEAIAEPDARKVAGYRLAMPTNDLSPDEIDAVVDYIQELAEQGDG